MSNRFDGGALVRIGILMLAAVMALVAALVSSSPAKGDTLPYVSDGGHVSSPPPDQIIPTPLDPGDWALMGRTPHDAVDSIGATNLRYLTAEWPIPVNGPPGHTRGSH
jgi:hypothetical protein